MTDNRDNRDDVDGPESFDLSSPEAAAALHATIEAGISETIALALAMLADAGIAATREQLAAMPARDVRDGTRLTFGQMLDRCRQRSWASYLQADDVFINSGH